MGSYVSQWVGLGRITKNPINLELIEIIQFCLKICDLLRPPTYGCMGSWVDQFVHEWVNGWHQVISLKIE